jgi:hypothetical protein
MQIWREKQIREYRYRYISGGSRLVLNTVKWIQPIFSTYFFLHIKVDGEKVFECIKNHRGTVFMVKRLSDVSTEKRDTTRSSEWLLNVNFLVDANPDPERISINMMPIFMRILLPKVSHKMEMRFFKLLVTALPAYDVFSFSTVSKMS